MKKRTVTIFGSSRCRPADELYKIAYELGATIAHRGWVVCNGGYAGTMEASAKGAAEGGGPTIGVTCERFSASAANPFIQEEIRATSLTERLATLARLGDAYVVLPGGTGTLLELSFVWERARKLGGGFSRPIVLLGDYWEAVIAAASRDNVERGVPVKARSVDELIAHLGA